MIKKLEISRFRCFDELVVENMAPITIVGGRNNSGKSALLDSIVLSNVILSPLYFTILSSIRGGDGRIVSSHQIWNPLFYRMGNNDNLCISYEYDDSKTRISLAKIFVEQSQDLQMALEGGNRKFNENEIKKQFALRMQYESLEQNITGRYIIQKDINNNNLVAFQPDKEISYPITSFENKLFYKFPAYIGQMPEWISQIGLETEKKNLLLKAVQKFDQDIIDVVTVIENGMSSVYVKFKSKDVMPINYMGDGINKAVSILLCILNSPDGILLIDEVENGLYFKLYEEIMPIVIETALEVNCQIIMTTHNKEIISTTAKIMEQMDKLDEISYIRMDMSKGKRQAFDFLGKDLISAINSNMEMR